MLFRSISGSIALAITDGASTWTTVSVENVILLKGKHRLVLYFDSGKPNVNFLKFNYSKKISEVPFNVRSVGTTTEGDSVTVSLTLPIPANVTLDINAFTVTIDTTKYPIKAIRRNSDNSISLALTNTVYLGQNIMLSYSGNGIKDTSNKILSTFDKMPVINNCTLKNPVSNAIVDSDGLLTIYPNPANNKITIVADEHEMVTIFTVDGIMVFQQMVTEGISSIDISALNTGAYMVKVKTSGRVSSSLLIKK